MLETPEERIKLLKAGISAKDIEKLYLIYNDFYVISNSILYEFNNYNHRKPENALQKKIRYSNWNTLKDEEISLIKEEQSLNHCIQ